MREKKMRLSVQFPLRRFLFLAFLLSSTNCAVREDLTNFQNEFPCDSSVRVVRPRNVQDVKDAVLRHARVVPVGAGHSWTKPFFCPEPASGSEETTANIVMTTIRPLKIDVDEEGLSVWVSAGVTVWDLMAYLSNFVTSSAPRGTPRKPVISRRSGVQATRGYKSGRSKQYSTTTNCPDDQAGVPPSAF